MHVSIEFKEEEDKPEDCIPDAPGNEDARDFLAHAPTRGLWMPLGREVKVMQCWRCKRYGHRTGDKECPFFIKGNQKLEQFRVAHEDPMYDLIRENRRHEKEMSLDHHCCCAPRLTVDPCDLCFQDTAAPAAAGRHDLRLGEQQFHLLTLRRGQEEEEERGQEEEEGEEKEEEEKKAQVRAIEQWFWIGLRAETALKKENESLDLEACASGIFQLSLRRNEAESISLD
nr:PREDICTED: retinitis pigmentosa 9 protein isoform X2 [Lepisosteus oculatus]XP_015213039.1 PREDICTED: retinitis pigmentosa 9 protein isoform X2 [Lepisosteus oculatus]XP_015213040.1 PREDICTED: retinitis pigmentosa 9 protein isoform X2 [Lepisosteus oculatus]